MQVFNGHVLGTSAMTPDTEARLVGKFNALESDVRAMSRQLSALLEKLLDEVKRPPHTRDLSG